MDLSGRLMMMVSSSSVFVNRLPPQRSLTPEGREKLRVRLFGFGVEKSTAYKAPEAAIEGVPATGLSPEIDLMSALSIMVASSRRRRQRLSQSAEVHLIGRGVAEGLVNAPCVVEGEVLCQRAARFAARGVRV